ncbi:MAG TPA: glutaredoxin family protein [Burkholderiales bacterium]|nr:glutaredoxin family protein [Burkholderiales bacterium]
MYGRGGCHLCEAMAAELRALGVAFEEIDVDSDPELRVKYGRDVPVLVFGDLVCRHRLTPEAIAKLR